MAWKTEEDTPKMARICLRKDWPILGLDTTLPTIEYVFSINEHKGKLLIMEIWHMVATQRQQTMKT